MPTLMRSKMGHEVKCPVESEKEFNISKCSYDKTDFNDFLLHIKSWSDPENLIFSLWCASQSLIGS